MIRWLRRKRPVDVRTDESRQALEASLKNKPEVDALVKDLRERRVRNNFAPALEAALAAHPRRR